MTTLVIRGGLVIDGTGAPAYTADVAISGELISAIGPDLKVASGVREIDARGLLVAPGWIDVHTHYDAQATWDPLLTPSAHCGVTTAIMGNCGVGFAPCQAELRPFLLELMEAVEDIPGAALHEGIQWEWETFPEYLDALARREYACDVAVMIGHGGVRTWVLGKRANVSDRPGGPEKDPVTDEEIKSMAAVVREAVAAGALGFSTSRLLLHRDNRGVLTPGCLAAKKEMLSICDAVTAGGGGVYEMSADFSCYDDIPYHKLDQNKRAEFANSELGWMSEAMASSDKLRVTFGMGPAGVPFFSKWASKVSTFPGQCVIQFQTRPQSFHMSHASGKNPFSSSAHYQRARKAASGDTDKLLELLQEPGTRAAIMRDMEGFQSIGAGLVFENYRNDKGVIIPVWMINGDHIYPWVESYEPTTDTMATHVAEATGRSALDVCYDWLLDTQGAHAGVLWRPLFGYEGNNDNILDGLEYPNVIPGFDDAGAHCTILTDATCATSNIAYYGRDRTIGRGTLPLEKLVKVQTGDAAAIFGLKDRGLLKQGMRADINIMDLEKLKIGAPYWANDLPTNAGRWLQHTEGYRATILRGAVTFEHDQHTGELPGRLVRNPDAVGLAHGGPGAKAASADEDVEEEDLSKYAVDISRGGGASAVARVLRDQDQNMESKSRL
jgi:N-acyl-D-aspartate/D-glutamate deacylase